MTCNQCGVASTVPNAKFCEECGSPFVKEVAIELGCPACGAPPSAIDAHGFCTQCGLERHQANLRDHWEMNISGNLAGVCDLGLKRLRNEDYMAMGEEGLLQVGVVCDGVSQSRDAGDAASAAAPLVSEVLLKAAKANPELDVEQAMREAVRAAQRVVSKLADKNNDGDDAPASTLIVACVRKADVTIGWLGDCRAYWLGQEPRLLTKDHSWLNEVVDAGKLTLEEATTRKGAHAVTRSLGGPPFDSACKEDEPSIAHFTLRGPGWLLLCSDGLWNYAPEASVLTAWLQELPSAETEALAVARGLVERARKSGGRDNITAVLIRLS